MRRTLVAIVLLSAACARATWEGNQTLARDVAWQPDSLLLTAVQALRDHGYDARIVDDNTIITTPKSLPVYERPVSTAADTAPSSWVLRVQVEPNPFRAGSRLALTGFLVPRESERMTDTTLTRYTTPISETRQPRLFSEVERVGNWILEAAAARRNP